jgi:hypothetical protein
MNYLKSWNFMRVLRFTFVGGAIIQALITKDITLGVLGIIVGGMALLNVGCCGTNGCETKLKNTNSKNPIKDVEFEEVVSK